MSFSNFTKHISLVLKHKHQVFKNCKKCGIIWQGLIHDFSKFSPTELFESVKYFQGNRSPIPAARRDTGMSYAWLHHKGRNKHHIEYWLDGDCEVQPIMPYKYAVECICDKIAATKIYNGKEYSEDKPLSHWQRYGNRVKGNPKTMAFIEKVFQDLKAHGEKYVLNKHYMRKTYDEICK